MPDRLSKRAQQQIRIANERAQRDQRRNPSVWVGDGTPIPKRPSGFKLPNPFRNQHFGKRGGS